MIHFITSLIKDFTSLIYPKLCITCGNDLGGREELMCSQCEYDLPKTMFHQETDNPVEQIFWGRTIVEQATAFFFYMKGSRYQKLIHDLKYRGKKHIGQKMGRKMAMELMNTTFEEVDAIVPVPLHPRKERKRGYNQSEWIARGISEVFEAPVVNNSLYRKMNNKSQTKKSRFDRWQNVKDVFALKNENDFKNKHVLLVDDVITTGATVEACINQLLNCENCRVSLISLGYSKD